jgi:hypothetical protein
MSFIKWLNHIIWCHFNREMVLSGIIKTSSGKATDSGGARNRERKGRWRPCRSRGGRTRPCHRCTGFLQETDTTLKKPTCSELAIPRVDIDFWKFLLIFSHPILCASQHGHRCLDRRIVRSHGYSHDFTLDSQNTPHARIRHLERDLRVPIMCGPTDHG